MSKINTDRIGTRDGTLDIDVKSIMVRDDSMDNLGDYEQGLELTQQHQYIWKGESKYTVKLGHAPFVLTGVWEFDKEKLEIYGAWDHSALTNRDKEGSHSAGAITYEHGTVFPDNSLGKELQTLKNNSSDYQIVDSFEQGATITERNQALQVEADGRLYRWAGDLPKTVVAGSSPETAGGAQVGAWLEVSDLTLRQELANPDKGAAMVARSVVAVDSIADLLDLPVEYIREDLRYLVKGYHAGSDVGGGEFYWEQGSVSADNGGTVLGSGLDGRWKRKPVGYVSPEMFGAVCDGVASDVDAIQHAHDSLPPEGGIIKFSRDLTYSVGASPVLIYKSNIKIDFNFCKLRMDNHSGTAFEVTPSSLIASGRKEGADYPDEWRINGVPYGYEGEWRTMMHEHRDAERVKNLVISNCVTTEAFIGTLFQIFSVDGVAVEDSSLAAEGHSNLRFWHSTDITLTRNHFSGSGTYLVFLFKCRIAKVHQNTFDSVESTNTQTTRHLSFKATYHGGGSIFLKHSVGYTDMSIDVSDNEHRGDGRQLRQVFCIDTGTDMHEDAVGIGGGKNIGFTKLEHFGGYAENLSICNNKYLISGGERATAVSVLAANRNTTINGNRIENGNIYVVGGQGLDIMHNEITNNILSSSGAPISSAWSTSTMPDSRPEKIRIINNKIDGHISDGSDRVHNSALWIIGKYVEVSGNTLTNPRGNTLYFAQLEQVDNTDYVWGENNTVILGSESTSFYKNSAIRTVVGVNPNGGTIRCAVINPVTGQSRGVSNTRGFGANITVRGSSSAGSVTNGTRRADYYIVNDLCFFHLYIAWSNLTGTGGLQITGMPLKVNDASNRAYQVFNVAGKVTYPSGQLVAYMYPSEDFIRLAIMTGESGNLLNVPVVPSGELYISGFYPYKAES